MGKGRIGKLFRFLAFFQGKIFMYAFTVLLGVWQCLK